jgi:epoxyqueuosine reductase
MERVWAARAGLGWAGANGLLTTPGYGSWVFLGVILTTLPLAPDVPLESRCGMCRLCMQSCPTRAIVAPGVIDARRCIAYHTVENRGDIPEEVQRQMGEWVFGCDICQEVCPWNARPVVTTERRFDPVNHDIEPGVVELSEDAFNARFAGSAIRRAKREGIRRNMGIVGRG